MVCGITSAMDLEALLRACSDDRGDGSLHFVRVTIKSRVAADSHPPVLRSERSDIIASRTLERGKRCHKIANAVVAASRKPKFKDIEKLARNNNTTFEINK